MTRPATAVAALVLAIGHSCAGGHTASTSQAPRPLLAGRVIQIDPGHNPGN